MIVGYSRKFTSYAFTVSGAGTSSVNGGYNASGTYGSQTAYTNGTDWLFYQSSGGGHWCIAATKGGVSYYIAATSGSSSSNITGSWNVGTGSSPAPTIVAG
jgi:hypothetical protein